MRRSPLRGPGRATASPPHPRLTRRDGHWRPGAEIQRVARGRACWRGARSPARRGEVGRRGRRVLTVRPCTNRATPARPVSPTLHPERGRCQVLVMKKGPGYRKQMGTFHPMNAWSVPRRRCRRRSFRPSRCTWPFWARAPVKLEGHRMDGDIALTKQIPVRSCSTRGYPRGASAR